MSPICTVAFAIMKSNGVNGTEWVKRSYKGNGYIRKRSRVIRESKAVATRPRSSCSLLRMELDDKTDDFVVSDGRGRPENEGNQLEEVTS